jgi:hypothetical protein
VAQRFLCKREMLREIIHIEHVKNFAEHGLNWWLSYTMSQPVQFDISIIALLTVQYMGLGKAIHALIAGPEELP